MRSLLIAVCLPLALSACSISGSVSTTETTVIPPPKAQQENSHVAAPSALQATLTLTRYHWLLDDARDAAGKRIDALFVRADKPIQLDFNASTVSVGNACNTLSAHHTPSGDSLTIDPMATTLMACPDQALAALDREVGKRLQGKLAMQIEEGATPTLVLTNAAGDVLRFKGQATADTRYGGPGERMFLEVAAATKACSHPLIPNMQCLQVREIKYDDNGLKVGTPGVFENFYSSIEGYTHQDGVRNVLRVHRYTVANPPADGSKYAYVLDMTVESDASGK